MTDLETQYLGKYIGPQQITGIELTQQKTSSGSMVFEFTVMKKVGDKEIFEKVLVPEKAIPLMVTDAETDWNTLSASKMNIIIEETVKVLEDYNIEKVAVDTLLQGLKTSLNFRFDRAKNFMWTGNDNLFIPGYDPDRDVSLLQAEAIIESIPNTNGESENNNAS